MNIAKNGRYQIQRDALLSSIIYTKFSKGDNDDCICIKIGDSEILLESTLKTLNIF